jgi:hypothetical protein
MEPRPYIDRTKEYLEYVIKTADPNSVDKRNAIAELEYRESHENLKKISNLSTITPNKKWYEKPFGIIALSVLGGLFVAYLIYVFGWNK